MTVQFLEVEALILVVIQLCQRNSGKMDEAGREVVYMCSLLQTVSFREQIILYYCRFVTDLTWICWVAQDHRICVMQSWAYYACEKKIRASIFCRHLVINLISSGLSGTHIKIIINENSKTWCFRYQASVFLSLASRLFFLLSHFEIVLFFFFVVLMVSSPRNCHVPTKEAEGLK